MQIAIIGAGNVGGALGKGWTRAGHTITYGVRDPSAAKHQAMAPTPRPRISSAGLSLPPRDTDR